MDVPFYEDPSVTIHQGHVLDVLRGLPDESAHCVVTSPPYWGLRDYGTAAWDGGDPACAHLGRLKPRQDTTGGCGGNGRFAETRGTQPAKSVHAVPVRERCACGARRVDGQIGLEPTPEEYVAALVEVFREVRRVLREDGTLWLNLGDCYFTSPHGPIGANTSDPKYGAARNRSGNQVNRQKSLPGLKHKDLVGIPWRVAFALQADGWWLRSDIIWAKPNPMPESVTDRPTKAHEYLFLMAKAERYFYDAEAVKERRADDRESDGALQPSERNRGGRVDGFTKPNGIDLAHLGGMRNRRSVWTIATAPYAEAHFATFPPDLVRPCILAGTSARGVCAACGAPWERVTTAARSFESGSGRAGNLPVGKGHVSSQVRVGHDIRMGPVTSTSTLGWSPTCACPGQRGRTVPATVLDPFGGAMTTAVVAKELDRRAVMAELNPDYCAMGVRRLRGVSAQRALLL